MDVHGNTVTRVNIHQDVLIWDLVWNSEKFNMEERDDTSNPFVDNRFSSRLCVLAVCFKNGDIKLIRSYDDVNPIVSCLKFLTKRPTLSSIYHNIFLTGMLKVYTFRLFSKCLFIFVML